MIDPNFILPNDFWNETQPRAGDSLQTLKDREIGAKIMPVAVLTALGSAASLTALNLETGNNFVNGILFFTGLVGAMGSMTAAALASESVSQAHEAEDPRVDCRADKLPFMHPDQG